MPANLTPRKIPLTKIRTTYSAAKTQVREQVSLDTVDSYAEAMQRGDEFPPVDLVSDGNGGYFIADGWHRVLARREVAKRRRTIKHIDAIVLAKIDGHSELESAIHHALSANRTHGLRLGRGDERAKARTALTLPALQALSDRRIAEQIGVSHQTVSRARNEMAREGLLPHPATGEPVDEWTPAEYVGVRVIKETFGGTDAFLKILRFVRQLDATVKRDWSYDPETSEVTHWGMANGGVIAFPVERNSVVDGKPVTRHTGERPDAGRTFTREDLDRFARETAKREFEDAKRRLEATGKRDLAAAVKTLAKYRNVPALFKDIRALVLAGGPPSEQEHEEF